MRRNKRRAAGDIAIDLTSLLDVIFIVLMVVLCGQKFSAANLTDEYEKNITEAAAAQAEAENAKLLYEEMTDIENDLGKFVRTAAVAVPYDKNEITRRTIEILTEGSEIESIPLNGIDTAEALDKFRETLEKFIRANAENPVIISLNDDDDLILYRDEKAVSEILRELSAEYGNVYIKGNLSEAEK